MSSVGQEITRKLGSEAEDKSERGAGLELGSGLGPQDSCWASQPRTSSLRAIWRAQVWG